MHIITQNSQKNLDDGEHLHFVLSGLALFPTSAEDILDIYSNNKNSILKKSSGIVALSAARLGNELVLNQMLETFMPDNLLLENVFIETKNWELLKKYAYYELDDHSIGLKRRVVCELLKHQQEDILIYFINKDIIQDKEYCINMGCEFKNINFLNQFYAKNSASVTRIFNSILTSNKTSSENKDFLSKFLLNVKLNSNLQVDNSIDKKNKI